MRIRADPDPKPWFISFGICLHINIRKQTFDMESLNNTPGDLNICHCALLEAQVVKKFDFEFFSRKKFKPQI